MQLTSVLKLFTRRWWLVLLPVIVVAALVVPSLLREPNAGGGFAVTLRFSAAQVLEAIPGRDGDFQDVWLASELTVNALTDWLRTSSFMDEVSQAVASKGVALNSAALGIAADNKRSVGQLAMSYPNSDDLSQIVSAAVDVLQTRAQVYFPQLGGREAQVTILDVPTITANPPPLTNRFAPFLRLAMGLVAGLLLAALAEYFDPMLRRREQVESLGLTVLATLPKH